MLRCRLKFLILLMRLSIYSPGGTTPIGTVSSMTLPGMSGSFQLLPHHADMVALLDRGKITYRTVEGAMGTWDVCGGMVEVLAGDVCVFLKEDALN